MRGEFEADYVLLLNRWDIKPGDDINDHGYWSGWGRRHWPAEIVRKGFRFYGCIGTGHDRRLRYLLEATCGGSFQYQNLEEFSRKVLLAIGERPSRSDPHWKRIAPGTLKSPATGVAMLWRLVKCVNVPFDKRFRQIGWMELNRSEWRVDRSVDLADLHTEGMPKLKSHIVYERKPALRRKSLSYWRREMNGRLRCIACEFDFGKCYGVHGEDFIEMHHELPLSRRVKRKRSVADLKPVCSNCHRMIHRKSGAYLEIPDLVAILKQSRK